MAELPTIVRCPGCGAEVPVTDEWRVVQCPNCGNPITRMAIDSQYD